jgi:hypothetical protein
VARRSDQHSGTRLLPTSEPPHDPIGVEVDVRLSEPVGWGLSAANTFDKTTAFANDGGAGTRTAESAIEEPDDRAADRVCCETAHVVLVKLLVWV